MKNAFQLVDLLGLDGCRTRGGVAGGGSAANSFRSLVSGRPRDLPAGLVAGLGGRLGFRLPGPLVPPGGRVAPVQQDGGAVSFGGSADCGGARMRGAQSAGEA